MIFIRIITVLAVVSSLICVLGAVAVVDGSGRNFWNSHAIVVGKVDSVVSDSLGNHFHVKLLGVVTTELVVPVELTVHYSPGPESALPTVVDGSTLLLCIEKDNGGWKLPTNGLSFLPSGCAVQPVDGLSDPLIEKVAQTATKLRSR